VNRQATIFAILFFVLLCSCSKNGTPVAATDPKAETPVVAEKFSYSYVPGPHDWTVRGSAVPLYSNGSLSFSFAGPFSAVSYTTIVELENSIFHDIRRATTATLSFSVLPQNVPDGSLFSVYSGTSQISRFSMSLSSSQVIQIPSSYFKNQSFGFSLQFRFAKIVTAPAYQCSVSVMNIALNASN